MEPPVLRTPLVLLAALVAGLPAGCTSQRRLDAHVFHDEPGLELRVTRVYERVPLHFTGEIYLVECRSEATRDFPETGLQEAGWRMLERGGAVGTESARDLLPELRPRYRVLEGPTLVVLGTVFHVSFDGCGTLARWDPTALPSEWIDPAPKPDFCAPVGTGDCRYMDFEGERAPVYEDVEADPVTGRVAFTVTSPTFRTGPRLRVRSRDGGRSWDVEPLPGGRGAPGPGQRGEEPASGAPLRTGP